MPINFLQLIHFYKAITSAISGQYERTFKGKDKGVEPFAQPQAVNTPLKSRDIENAFSRFTNGNESETADFKVLAKQIPMYALQRKPSNNDSLNQGERKTAFSTKWLLPTEIQASPDIILPSESLPLKSEQYSDEFKSQYSDEFKSDKIRAVQENGVLPSVIHTERGVSGLMLPIKPHMGQEISIHEEAEPPMQNSIPEALKPTQDPPQLFTKLFQLGLEVIDTFGMVITTERFRVEYMGYQKQNPPTSERTKEEDKNNKSVKIRTYADDSTIKRFQTKIDSKFKVEESEPVPFLIPLGQARSVLPPLSSIQEVTKNLTDRINSNEITPDNFTDRTNQSETDVIKYSFRPDLLSSQPPGEAEIFDKKTEGGWYNGKKEISLSESIWDSVDRAERPENSKDELTNAKPAVQARGGGEVSAPLNVKLDNSIIEEVGEFLTNQINDFKKVASDMANGVASIFGQDAKASETPKSETKTRSCGRLQDEQTEVAKQSSSQERC